jgi:hypothetical protein
MFKKMKRKLRPDEFYGAITILMNLIAWTWHLSVRPIASNSALLWVGLGSALLATITLLLVNKALLQDWKSTARAIEGHISTFIILGVLWIGIILSKGDVAAFVVVIYVSTCYFALLILEVKMGRRLCWNAFEK